MGDHQQLVVRDGGVLEPTVRMTQYVNYSRCLIKASKVLVWVMIAVELSDPLLSLGGPPNW
jgi:hypothetical protein